MEIRQSKARVAVAPPATAEAASAPAAARAESKRITPPAYMSPVIQIDAAAGLAVLVVRDGDSGEVKAQYPAKQVVQEYRRYAKSPEQPAQGQQAKSQQAATVSPQPVAAAVSPQPVAAAVSPQPVAAAPVKTGTSISA